MQTGEGWNYAEAAGSLPLPGMVKSIPPILASLGFCAFLLAILCRRINSIVATDISAFCREAVQCNSCPKMRI